MPTHETQYGDIFKPASQPLFLNYFTLISTDNCSPTVSVLFTVFDLMNFIPAQNDHWEITLNIQGYARRIKCMFDPNCKPISERLISKNARDSNEYNYELL